MPPLQPVVGRAPLYARDPATGDIYEIGGAGASEVFIGDMDPYSSNANATDELWLDTSANPPVLKGRVGGQWVVVSSEPPKPEVIVGGTIPAPSEDAVWVTDTTMVPPSPGAPMKALWVYDSSAGASAGWHLVETGGGSEIEISDVDPITVNPEYELWVDSGTPTPSPVPVDEVWIGPDDPRATYPGNETELWYDVDAVALTAGGVPRGGTVGQVLRKVSGQDGDIMWGGQPIYFESTEGDKLYLYPGPTPGTTSYGMGIAASTLSVFAASGAKIAFRQGGTGGAEWGYISAAGLHVVGRHAYTDTDGYGWMMNSGSGIYKKSGSGVTIRQHSGNTQPGIENNDGSNRRDIIDTTNGDARYIRKSDSYADVTVTSSCDIWEGNNKIFYNDAVVCWNLTVHNMDTNEQDLRTAVAASGYPSSLRPSHNIQLITNAIHDDNSAVTIGMRIYIYASGEVKWLKPSNGPDITSNAILSFNFSYPRNY